ncbi:MAG: hypothetical protein QOI48_500 [Solirubrobacteraceae bacterium]|jgi:hypothetical protein|nr:hypothetical protein [Solirubrobacteraceae bacterium]
MRGVKCTRDGSRAVCLTIVEAAVAAASAVSSVVASLAGSGSLRRGADGLLVVVCAGSGSGGRGERAGACERGDERVGPAPGGVDA